MKVRSKVFLCALVNIVLIRFAVPVPNRNRALPIHFTTSLPFSLSRSYLLLPTVLSINPSRFCAGVRICSAEASIMDMIWHIRI